MAKFDKYLEVKQRSVKLKLPWYTADCSSKDCWCRVVCNSNTAKDDEDYVLPSGAIHKQDAELMVEFVNDYPAAVELIEFIEQSIRRSSLNGRTHITLENADDIMARINEFKGLQD